MAHINYLSLFLFAGLSACGGGGGTTAAPNNYTQADVNAVAVGGLTASLLTGNQATVATAYLATIIEYLALDTSVVSGPKTLPVVLCNSASGGTLTVTVSKATAHTGLRANDEVAVIAKNCDCGGDIFDGSAKLLMKSNIAFSATGLSFAFQTTTNKFSVDHQKAINIYSGVVETAVTTDVVNHTVNVAGVVSTGPGYSISISQGTSESMLSYQPGTNFDVTNYLASRNAIVKLDGTILYGESRTSPLAMSISMPTALSGPAPAAGKSFVATAGLINAKAIDANVATSTLIHGGSITVNGDTDRNGVMDIVFDTTWDRMLAVKPQ